MRSPPRAMESRQVQAQRRSRAIVPTPAEEFSDFLVGALQLLPMALATGTVGTILHAPPNTSLGAKCFRYILTWAVQPRRPVQSLSGKSGIQSGRPNVSTCVAAVMAMNSLPPAW